MAESITTHTQPADAALARGGAFGADSRAQNMLLFEFQLSQLDRAVDDVAGLLTGVKLGLYQVPLDINQSTTLAALTAAKATFTSYVKTALVWDTPSVADDGTVEVVSHALTFRPTDAVNPNQIWGCWIEDSTAAYLYYAGQFDGAPLPMTNALQQIVIQIRYRPASDTLVVIVS